ncbi:hypothetical protein M422DRAFT_259578 [Sphaerobolus stellatus SS14]|uniref:Unplaced genomic scaffold SPHSTscaffold_91, whole genome shotgun sequence n=1 Tax=Sphaerobolus stellatus (strain SS14) TaxID=990650 RepID=A0A0C9VJE1_SPHS4|nr:hypothetical protein M422DRAFT_259578 [Sphaerobolus stellatus SS14]
MFDIANVNYYDIMLGTPFLRRVKANIDFNGLGSIVINGEMIDTDLSVWLASEEAKIHGMLTNKVTPQEEKPLGLIVEQLSISLKEKSFETVRNKLLVVPVPQTWEELKMLISLCIYMDKPYVCNEEVYNVIVDINSALDTDTNVVKYYDDIVIKDGYLVHHKDNSYSMKPVSKNDYKTSLNGQNQAGVSIEEVNDEDNLQNIAKNDDIVDNNHSLVDMKPPPSHSFQN